MIFSTSEPPQYMVVSLTDRELKDRFVYRNKYLTIKNSIQTAFFKKCACLLSASALNGIVKTPSDLEYVVNIAAW